MSKGQKVLTREEKVATLNMDKFKALTKDLMDAYDKGRFRIILSGSRISGSMPNSLQQLIRKKHEVDAEFFNSIVEGLLFCMHYILGEEDRDIVKNLQKKKSEHVVGMKEKIAFVKEIVEKHPRIKESFLVHTYCLSSVLDDVDWETDLKFNTSEFGVNEPFEPFALGKIKIAVVKEASSPKKSEFDSIEFDVSLEDVKYLRESLEKLEASLNALKGKKLT
jgi:hypothetical protein